MQSRFIESHQLYLNMQSHLHIKLILGLVVAFASNFIFASDVLITTPEGYVTKLCEADCQQSMEQPLVDHCERGCRFFDLAQTSNLLDLNATISTSICIDSCKEAYKNVTNQNVCVLGCNKAKEEIDHLEEMANNMFEVAEKEMNFFNLMLSKVSSSFWSSSDSKEESDELTEDHDIVFNPLMNRPIFSLNDGLSKVNELDANSNNEVEIITLVGDDMASIDTAGNLCATRIWLHRLSFILIVMGVLSLLLVTIFYIAAVIKYKKVKNMKQAGGDLSKPPSYETLVKDGYIMMSNDIVPSIIAKEKDEKLFIA